tara:strand:+ start:107 stop:292 length:186 start_codon:yes stop_codon:yes gene_type:complete
MREKTWRKKLLSKRITRQCATIAAPVLAMTGCVIVKDWGGKVIEAPASMNAKELVRPTVAA